MMTVGEQVMLYLILYSPQHVLTYCPHPEVDGRMPLSDYIIGIYIDLEGYENSVDIEALGGGKYDVFGNVIPIPN